MAVSVALENVTLYIKHRQSFINDESFSLLMLINPAVITCTISVVGIGVNILNIATFINMGFKETINISLLALAVADLASLICLVWMCLCFSPSFCDLVCDFIDLPAVEEFLGGEQRSYFTTVAGCITCVIACERCLCVLRPLQVKLILTRKKLISTIVAIYVLSFLPYAPIYYTTRMVWVFNPKTNGSLLTRTHNDDMYILDFLAFGTVMAVNSLTFIVVTVFTALIVWKLTSQSQWRAGQAIEQSRAKGSGDTDLESEEKQSNKKKGLSEKDKRATMTVTVIAAMYIACFFPGRVLYLVMTVVPDFNKGMLYSNLYDFMWYLSYVFESICSSTNMIVYLKTSTKFKLAFFALFSKTAAGSSAGVT